MRRLVMEVVCDGCGTLVPETEANHIEHIITPGTPGKVRTLEQDSCEECLPSMLGNARPTANNKRSARVQSITKVTPYGTTERLKCPECGGATGSTPRGLLMHMTRIHPEVPLAEAQQRLGFKVTGRNVRSEEKHPLGVPRALCPECGQDFTNAQGVSAHWRAKHPDTFTIKETTRTKKPKGLACPECGEHYERPQGLASHRRYTHGVLGVSNPQRVAEANSKADETG